jgi:hypothetical protein
VGPQQPAPLPTVPQQPCAATLTGMIPPFRSAVTSPLVFMLDASIVVLLV